MDTQPAEANAPGNNRQRNQDVGSPVTEIGETADYEEHHDLDGERDSIGEEHDAVDITWSTEKVE